MPLSISADAQTAKLAGFGYTTDLSNRTWNLKAGIVEADVGKAVAFEAANTVRLALTGDRIIGRLEVVEDRVSEGTLLGTVKMDLQGVKIAVLAADALAAGDYCVGGGLGTVRKHVAGDVTAAIPKNLLAVAVSGGFATVYNV